MTTKSTNAEPGAFTTGSRVIAEMSTSAISGATAGVPAAARLPRQRAHLRRSDPPPGFGRAQDGRDRLPRVRFPPTSRTAPWSSFPRRRLRRRGGRRRGTRVGRGSSDASRSRRGRDRRGELQQELRHPERTATVVLMNVFPGPSPGPLVPELIELFSYKPLAPLRASFLLTSPQQLAWLIDSSED